MLKKIALAAAAILTVAGLSFGGGTAEASGYRNGHGHRNFGYAFHHNKFHGYYGFRHYRPCHYSFHRYGHNYGYGHKHFRRWW